MNQDLVQALGTIISPLSHHSSMFLYLSMGVIIGWLIFGRCMKVWSLNEASGVGIILIVLAIILNCGAYHKSQNEATDLYEVIKSGQFQISSRSDSGYVTVYDTRTTKMFGQDVATKRLVVTLTLDQVHKCEELLASK